MNKLYLYINVFALLSVSGCCSSGGADGNCRTDNDGRQTVPVLSDRNPTAVRQNATIIEATVDSISLRDTIGYSLYMTITDAAAMEDIDSFAEAGQHIAASPAYFINDAGNIGLTETRNRKLFALRSALPGSSVKCKVSLTGGGSWAILDGTE